MRGRRIVWVLLALLLVGGGTAYGVMAPSGSDRRFADRAAAVAGAWPGSAAQRAWRSGYFPLGRTTVPPAGGFHSEADRKAFESWRFTLRGTLSRSEPSLKAVTWPDGGKVAVRVESAADTYRRLQRWSRGDGSRLVVTGAQEGTLPVATSRGTATVPAWFFSLQGYDRPLVRVAALPTTTTPQGALDPPEGPGNGLERIQFVVTPAAGSRTLTVGVLHGACDRGWGAQVYETDDAVVVGGWYRRPESGSCTALGLVDPATVTLQRPLGSRTLLDARSAAPVALRPW